MYQRFIRQMAFLMDKAGDGTGGGGGGGGGTGGDGKGAGGAGDGKGSGAGGGDEVAALRSQNAALEARLAKLEGKGDGKGAGEGDDLADKARKEREEQDRKAGDTKSLSAAIKFNMGGKDWLKTNESLLPKTVPGIFEQAEKENYGNDVEKASAIKVGVVQEFFALQANLDLLTVAQKTALEDFQKLTKTEKQARVQSVYDMVFEPAFETLRREKKAEQLKRGHGSQTDAENAYKEKLMKGSRTHYLGEKQNA